MIVIPTSVRTMRCRSFIRGSEMFGDPSGTPFSASSAGRLTGDAVISSRRLPSGGRRALVALLLVPQPVQPLQRRRTEEEPALVRQPLQRAEAARKLGVGAGQRGAGVHVRQPRQVDGGEEEVAQL